MRSNRPPLPSVAALTLIAACGADPASGPPDAAAGADVATDAVAGCPPTGAGTPCNDGDPCTSGDSCNAGVCAGAKKACDDGKPCTEDACDLAGACTHTTLKTSCLIGGVCHDSGAAKPGDVCRTCQPAKSAVGFSIAATACDDGNACTKGEACDLAGACTGSAVACGDDNDCTVDSCVPATGCVHGVKTGPCSDGNPCSVGDLCDGKTCKAGTAVLGCDDKNTCTVDSCKAGVGCAHALSKAPCDDGEACTTPDTCTGGVCVGVKTNACPTCNLLFGSSASKLIQFQIGTSGAPGDGIDVDGDPKTCAPAANCSGGIDNAAALLAGFINKPIIASVDDGTLTFVAELAGYVGEGIPFTLNLYYAEMAKESKDAGCKPHAEVCKWLIGQSALTAQCKPKFSFASAMVKNGKLEAGTKDTVFAMDASMIGAKNATLYVKGARILGEVTFVAGTNEVKAVQGILGGAVPQTAIVDIIGSLDASAFAAFGLSKAQVLTIVEAVLEIDQDVDGDGQKDAASIGIRFSGVGAVLAGTAP